MFFGTEPFNKEILIPELSGKRDRTTNSGFGEARCLNFTRETP